MVEAVDVAAVVVEVDAVEDGVEAVVDADGGTKTDLLESTKSFYLQKNPRLLASCQTIFVASFEKYRGDVKRKTGLIFKIPQKPRSCGLLLNYRQAKTSTGSSLHS